VFTAYSSNSPLKGVQFIGTLYLSPVFSTACKNGEPKATCSTLLIVIAGLNSAANSFLNAGDDGVVPGVAGSSSTYPNFLTLSDVEIGNDVLY
jgi:hypothetical protein